MKCFSLKQLIIVTALSIITSCGGGSATSSGTPYLYAELDSFSTGSEPLNFQSASVSVIDDSSGNPITNATVTINGINLPYIASQQEYQGNLVVIPGTSVNVNVSVGGNTYSATGTQFTSYPTISAPAAGATWHTDIANTVTWSPGFPISNASYGLGILDTGDPNGQLVWPPSTDNSLQVLPIGTTSYSIPANTLTAGNRLVIIGLATVTNITGAAPGSSFIISGFNSVPINISSSTLTYIAIAPANPSIAKGATQQFTAIGTFSDSSTQDLTTQVTWASSDISKASISSSGLAQGVDVGTSTISASLENISSSTTLTVTPAVLVSIAVSPTNQVIFNGSTQQFTAMGIYSDDTEQVMTESVTWTSSNTGVATISNAAGSNGKANAVASGTATITATSGNIAGSTMLTISEWTLANSGTSNGLRGVAWSGTQFVAVGDANTILTSSDGVQWTVQASGIFTYFYGTAWLGTQFAAMGQGNKILTSPDGILWTPHAYDSYNSLNGIAWSGTEYVAVGDLVLTSPDEVTWTSQSADITNSLTGIVWSGDKFVTVGYGGKILTSADGITWALQTSGTTNSLNSVAWSGAQFVAVGNTGTVLTSPDGITWTLRGGLTDSLYGIVWSGTQFVAVGSNGEDWNGEGQILTSPDGMTWTKIFGNINPQSNFLLGVTQFESRIVAVGGNGTILVSPNIN
jgi:hypothetical protein